MKERLEMQEALSHLDAVQNDLKSRPEVVVLEQPQEVKPRRRNYRPIPESEWHVPSVPFIPYKQNWEQGFADQHRWHGQNLSKSLRNMQNVLKEKG